MSQHNRSLKVDVLSQHLITLSQHCMRKVAKEAPKFCHDMEMNIATKLRMEGQKNVATFYNYVATKNRANGRKALSRRLKLCHDK